MTTGDETNQGTVYWKPAVLTREQVRELLEEGRLCRQELEGRLRKMHEIPFEVWHAKARNAGVAEPADASASSPDAHKA